MSKGEPLVQLNKASVVYRTETGEGRPVWSDVSLAIHEKEWIAVVGPNGSGKSTLAGVLLGLSPISEGTVARYEGLDNGMKGVLQLPEAQFIGDTVEDELDWIPYAQTLPEEARAAWYREVLTAVGLEISPKRSLLTLSGGQKQLVNLAVALATKPKLLVCDEATAMLDPAARQDVLAAVREAYRQGTTIVWITHRLEESSEATRVIGFGEGRVTYDGDPHAFFYGEGELSPCETLGFDLPYVVQTVRHLRKQGVALTALPLSMDELAEAVSCL
ncbi:ATP-binding cassette domain-containing protein [Paenibacillus ferrarius]|uniref:ATP-binding cassette domain-containing protein n=1 Tax=Paenibacillus ferrarius TaxID=1469647 RepID=UPI003D28B559